MGPLEKILVIKTHSGAFLLLGAANPFHPSMAFQEPVLNARHSIILIKESPCLVENWVNGIKCMAYLADNFYPWPTFANLLREMAAVLPVTALINPELAAESAKTLYSFALNFSEEPAAVEFANSMFKMQSRYYRQVAIAHRNTEFDAAFQHTPEPSLN